MRLAILFSILLKGNGILNHMTHDVVLLWIKFLLEILIGELNVWFSYVGSRYDMLKVLSLNTFYYGIPIP
jgi:hypothetical protein